MNVAFLMTSNPACCTPDTGLPVVARMMVDRDCGEIPVLESDENKIPIGVITDRDIVCRSVAKDMNPLEMRVSDCMTKPAFTVRRRSIGRRRVQNTRNKSDSRLPFVAERVGSWCIVSLPTLPWRCR